MSFLPLYLFLTLLSKSLFQEAIEDIHFVLIHSRHGARAPIQLDLNNTDIFGNKWEGQSELTETGVKQQYLIGLRNSIVYKNLYNPDYKNKEILVYSTNLNRTIMSAQAQLLGMYNNVHYNFESKNIKNVSQIDINNFDFDYDYSREDGDVGKQYLKYLKSDGKYVALNSSSIIGFCAGLTRFFLPFLN